MFLKPLALLLAVLAVGTLAGDQDVLDLTDNDFTTRIGEVDTVLVMFYAPW